MGNCCCWKMQDKPRLQGTVYEEFIFNDPPTPRNTGHMAPGMVCIPSPSPQREHTGRPTLWQPPAQSSSNSTEPSPSSNLGDV